MRGNGGAERRGVSKRGGGREGEIKGRREGENFNLKRGAGGWWGWGEGLNCEPTPNLPSSSPGCLGWAGLGEERSQGAARSRGERTSGSGMEGEREGGSSSEPRSAFPGCLSRLLSCTLIPSLLPLLSEVCKPNVTNQYEPRLRGCVRACVCVCERVC